MVLIVSNFVHSVSSWIENKNKTNIWKIIIFGYFMHVNKANFQIFKFIRNFAEKPILFKITKNVSPPSKIVIIS